MNSYYQGDLVNVTTGIGFKDINGNPVDPSAVVLVVGRRGQTANVNNSYPSNPGPITKVSTGNYAANIDTTSFVPDVYWYKWKGTGDQAVNEGSFLVMPVDV